jgi:hypothetical protein
LPANGGWTLRLESEGGDRPAGTPPEESGPLREAQALLEGLPGIVAVRRIDPVVLRDVAEEERSYQRGGLLPVRNVGIDTALQRQEVFEVLKDKSFRPPPAPTVYLVEELGAAGAADAGAADAAPKVPPGQTLEAGGRTYRILGEEVLPGHGPYHERTVDLAGTFVMFPGRRGNPKKPSYFLVPALGFVELEAVQERLGVRGVFSISPSARTDALLRQRCGFPQDPELATLLVGFDRA